MANRDTATFDLLLTLWVRKKALLLFVVVALVLGVAASLFLPPQHRATATLVPLTDGQAARLFPATVPGSTLKGGSGAFSPDSGELFDRLLVALSGDASQRTVQLPSAGETGLDYRLNQVNKEGRRYAELTASFSSVDEAFEGLKEWLAKSEKSALNALDTEYAGLVAKRLGDAEYLLGQKLAQEDYQLLAREQRLSYELKLVSALLSSVSVDAAIPDAFLFYPRQTENLFDDGLPPYLLSRDLLKARQAQLRLQIDQLTEGTEAGAYLPDIADLKAQKASLKALQESFMAWPSRAADRSLLRFSVFPSKEEASALKRSILFGAGGVMLGLLFGLVWVLLSEAVRVAQGHRE